MTLALRLKEARARAGLKQSEVAARAGMSQQNYQQLEAGKIQATTRLPQLAEALGVSVGWLIDQPEPELSHEALSVARLWQGLPQPFKQQIRAMIQALARL